MGAGPEYLRIAVWGGAALLGFVLFGAVVVVIRRRYRADHDAGTHTAWSLEDLNEMRRRGNLSETEYAHLRDRALSQMGIERPHGQ